MVTQRALLVVRGMVALLAGCTVPSEDSATRVPARNVPFQLAETTAANSSTLPSGATELVARCSWSANERLTVVSRGMSPADPSSVLSLLAQGPTNAETDAGLRTALVPDLAQIIEIDGELVTVDLDAEFNALAPTEQLLALAQITFTMTQIAAINNVEFLVAGQPASVPRGDGSSTDGPVSPVDYDDLAPI